MVAAVRSEALKPAVDSPASRIPKSTASQAKAKETPAAAVEGKKPKSFWSFGKSEKKIVDPLEAEAIKFRLETARLEKEEFAAPAYTLLLLM